MTETKVKIHKGIVESVLIQSRSFSRANDQMRQLRPMKIGYLRCCCSLTLQNKVQNEDIYGRLNIGTNISDIIDTKS